MLVIWAGRKEDAEAWRRRAGIGRQGVLCIGNHSPRAVDGLRPTGIIRLDGSGVGPDGGRIFNMLDRCSRKMLSSVPWLDLRGKIT